MFLNWWVYSGVYSNCQYIGIYFCHFILSFLFTLLFFPFLLFTYLQFSFFSFFLHSWFVSSVFTVFWSSYLIVLTCFSTKLSSPPKVSRYHALQSQCFWLRCVFAASFPHCAEFISLFPRGSSSLPEVPHLMDLLVNVCWWCWVFDVWNFFNLALILEVWFDWIWNSTSGVVFLAALGVDCRRELLAVVPVE